MRRQRHEGQFLMELWEVEGIYYKDFSFLQRADLKVQQIWKAKLPESFSPASIPTSLSLCPAEDSDFTNLPGEGPRNPQRTLWFD